MNKKQKIVAIVAVKAKKKKLIEVDVVVARDRNDFQYQRDLKQTEIVRQFRLQKKKNIRRF